MASILDGIIQGVFGTPTSQMTQQEGQRVEAQRKAQRGKAGDMATNAMKDPGEEFMPEHLNTGGGDLIETIGKIFKAIAGSGNGG